MPIRPIDLQSLFMQMGQVGREKAAEKEGAILQASMKGAAEQKRADEAKEAVRRPTDPEGGTPAVRDRKERPQGGREGRREGEAPAEEAESKEAEEVVRDPSLGTKIDLSG